MNYFRHRASALTQPDTVKARPRQPGSPSSIRPKETFWISRFGRLLLVVASSVGAGCTDIVFDTCEIVSISPSPVGQGVPVQYVGDWAFSQFGALQCTFEGFEWTADDGMTTFDLGDSSSPLHVGLPQGVYDVCFTARAECDDAFEGEVPVACRDCAQLVVGPAVVPQGEYCGRSSGAWEDLINNSGQAGFVDCTGGLCPGLVEGSDMADLLLGNDKPNEIDGKAGDDCIYGYGGGDDLRGRRGNDTIFGGDGNDEIRGDLHQDTLLGGGNNDTMWGGNGEDTMFGEAGNDEMRGGLGGDEMNGGSGRDKLRGGIGGDRMEGGPGEDFLRGGPGRDELFGDGGNDRLCGNNGLDDLDGGSGSDQCRKGFPGGPPLAACESTPSVSQCGLDAWNGW